MKQCPVTNKNKLRSTSPVRVDNRPKKKIRSVKKEFLNITDSLKGGLFRLSACDCESDVAQE